MLIYVYDGSFEGILTAVFEAFYRKEEPDAILTEDGLQYDLTASYNFIRTDPEKSDRVYTSIRRNICEDALKNVYNAFLSEEQDAATLIYRYLKLGWKMGDRVNLHLADRTVLKIQKISQRVEYEAHRLMGFLRFRQVEGGIFYSSINPDNNVVELLAPHFAERLSDQKWIIHDVKREIAALYNMKNWIISEFSAVDIPGSTADEKRFSSLWKEFFNALEISSRSNPKLQRRLMPRRYWDHLTEKW